MKTLAKKLFESKPEGFDVECPRTETIVHITPKDWRIFYANSRKTRNLVEKDGFYCPTCDVVHQLEPVLVGYGATTKI